MRPRTIASWFAITLVAATAHAQQPLDRKEALELLAASTRWVEIEGGLQADGTFVAKEIDIIAVDDTAHTNDMEISGVITKLDVPQKAMTLLGYRVSWDGKTKFTDDYKAKIDAGKLAVGSGVKATGRMQENGTFLTTKIRLREGKVKGNEVKHKEELLGPIQVTDAAAGKLLFAKTQVLLRPDCRFFALPAQAE